jgi:DNA-directed RNA polymerase specialized sigma24 family protein
VQKKTEKLQISRDPVGDFKKLAGTFHDVIQQARDGKTDSPEFNAKLGQARLAVVNVALDILRRGGCRDAVELSEVIASDFCMLLVAGFRQYRSSRPFTPYALATIRNLCIAKAWRPRKRVYAGDVGAVADHRSSERPSRTKIDSRYRVRRSVVRLKRNWRRALICRFWLRLKSKEGAKRLRTTESTFNGWIMRALKQLRGELGPEDFSDAA